VSSLEEAMQEGLATLGAGGVLFAALLSGWGAVAFPYATMSRFIRPVDDARIASVERHLLHTMLVPAPFPSTHTSSTSIAAYVSNWSLARKRRAAMATYRERPAAGGGGGVFSRIMGAFSRA
jgi:hypothetical protein